jgi:hypothetical protein
VHVGSNVVRGIVRNAATGAGSRAASSLRGRDAGRSTFGGRTVAEADGATSSVACRRRGTERHGLRGDRPFGQETADDVTVDASAPEAVRDFDLRAGAGLVVHVRDGDADRSSPSGACASSTRATPPIPSAPTTARMRRVPCASSASSRGAGRSRPPPPAHESSSTTLDLVADDERDVEITLRSSH